MRCPYKNSLRIYYIMADYEYTIGSYLSNPVGAGASTLPMRAKLLEALGLAYQTLKSKKEFKTRAFKVVKSYVLVVTVPSETIDNVFYDVAIEFKDAEGMSNLADRVIAVYSNSPAFVYTYAYVFNQRKMLIDYLKDHLGSDPLNKPPEKRNPDETINYEKSIVYAIMHIKNNGYLSKDNFASSLKISSESAIKSEIRTFDQAQENYTREKANQKYLKENEKAAKKEEKRNKVQARKDEIRGTNKVNSTVNNKVSNKVKLKVNNKVKR